MKKIILDEPCKQTLIKKFTDYINNTKFTDNHINFSTNFEELTNTEQLARPTVYIDAEAYLKMLLYIRDTDIEIAWHGTVERNQAKNYYIIKDVFLYPQTITSVTVNTDQTEYNDWLQNIEDDDVFNNIRFQGHSHVNMGTTPSGTDLNMYNNFLQVLPKNDYYIFMIMNKSGSVNCFIYDLAKNLIYESKNIDIKIKTTTTTDLLADIAAEKEKYCKKPQAGYFTSPAEAWQKANLNTEPPLFHNPYATQQYNRANYNAYKEFETKTETDLLFDEIDRRYKNAPLALKSFKKGK